MDSFRTSRTGAVLSPNLGRATPSRRPLSSSQTFAATSTATSVDISWSRRSQRMGSRSFSESSLFEMRSIQPLRPCLSLSNTGCFPSEAGAKPVQGVPAYLHLGYDLLQLLLH